MKGVIRKNEKIGKEIEKWAAELLGGKWIDSRNSPYDIDKPHTLIEVKSCQDKILNKTYNGKRYYRKGQFMIIFSSHNALLEEAKKQSKDPKYFFVLYHLYSNDKWFPLETKMLQWIDVNHKIQEKARHYTRSLGEIKIYYFRWDMIFAQQRL